MDWQCPCRHDAPPVLHDLQVTDLAAGRPCVPPAAEAPAAGDDRPVVLLQGVEDPQVVRHWGHVVDHCEVDSIGRHG